ncbi:MAG: ABC transporter ATP-binding protein [Crocinitomicaceae bacterium]|jgi:subfamily B ATP-binding cassette protein MsbA|nr:ABC transporter ATP-binding protein [Crocinitomicaceae bacterium]
MKALLDIFRQTFRYRLTAILVVFSNLMFVIFNLISLVLFIPFLQLIFPKESKEIDWIAKPVYEGGFIHFFEYCSDLYQYFMQQMVLKDPKQALLFVCVSVIIAFFLKNIFRYMAVYHQSQLRMAVVRDIRDSIFHKAMRLPLSFYTEERKGDIMSRMNNDVNEIEVAVVCMLELLFREPIAIIINLGVLIYWSPSLTMISLVLLPISAFVISRIGKSLKKTAKEGQEQMGVLFSSMDENLSGIRIIKAFNAVPYVNEVFSAINLKHQKLITLTFRKKDLSSPLNEFLGACVLIGIVWFGGTMILEAKENASLSGEEFLTFIIVFSQLLRPISGIAFCISCLNKAKVSQDRINEILEMDEKIYDADQPIPLPILEKGITYKNIYFKYKDEWVLKNINLFIPKGKTVALVGESGSGKSTISDLLPRFYDIQEGEILFDDVNLKEASLIDLRSHIGMVTQESILFNDTVRNNIAFGLTTAMNEDIIEAAKIANAHDFIMALDNGYDTNIGERGNKLSGGQKQRLSIARAVLRNPSILILDEATSALDTESEKLVQDALEKLMKNRTSLVIAHRLSTVKNADLIIVLQKGEIAEQGTHDELIAKKGMYYSLCNMQGL